MTETTAPEPTEPAPWDPSSDPDGVTVDEVTAPDYYLDFMLNAVLGFADDHDTSTFGLTVMTSGQLVTGLAITRNAWAQALSSAMQLSAPTLAEALDLIHADIAEEFKQLRERRDTAELPMPARRFLHMKDARVLTGNAELTVGLWRIPLAAITGWTMGQPTR